MVRFLHTSDWQLGKPYARIVNADRRAAARLSRLQAIDRLGAVARAEDCAFVVVAGDLFDSLRPDPDVQQAALQRLAALELPVYVIPGNHDYGGPESIWCDPGFRGALKARCPNVQVLLRTEPVQRPDCVLLPAPLLHRRSSEDPLAWLYEAAAAAALQQLDATLPRIVVAHGAAHGFAAVDDDDDFAVGSNNLLDLPRLRRAGLADYVALGDWHGRVAVDPQTHYSGTPEPDRFPKGKDYESGQVLVVDIARRGALPQVTAHRTGQLRWHVVAAVLSGEPSFLALREEVTRLTAGGRVHEDLLQLVVTGAVGLATRAAFDAWCEELRHSLVRLDLRATLATWPDAQELQQAFADTDPAIAAVKAELQLLHEQGGAAAAQAQRAMRWLYRAARMDPGAGDLGAGDLGAGDLGSGDLVLTKPPAASGGESTTATTR